jgi:hypothetical protein
MRSISVASLIVCLSMLGMGTALAQSPKAYVYVAEDAPSGSLSSPISVYASSSGGKLIKIKGSPFTQTSGAMVGTNGSHFITVDMNSNTTHQYLHVYSVASNGVIGEEVSKQDLHDWCEMDEGAEFDHTGQYVYVLEAQSCGGGYLSFALSKSGELTYKGSLTEESNDGNPFFTLPKFSGNDKFAYNFIETPDSVQPCPSPTSTFIGLSRSSSGALEDINFSETDPTPPPGYDAFQGGMVTPDPTTHLASVVVFQDGTCDQQLTPITALASYTIKSNGDLVSTNTSENMPGLAGYLAPSNIMKLNPAGTVLAVAVGTGIQFFHFNGAAPITPFAGNEIVGTSGYINDMEWDGDGHLYALNAKSGKLHVYTVTTKGVTEASGSPYLPPNSCTAGGCYPQAVIVRTIP